MKHFYVIANSIKDPDGVYAERICSYINGKGGKCVFHRFKESDKKSQKAGYSYTDMDLIPSDTECVIVLGGDGTLIQAARDIVLKNIPLLGINIGTLGFLTDVDINSFRSAIDDVMNDNFIFDDRMMLKGSIYRDGELVFENIALNDIVINRCGNLRIIDFDVAVNGQYLSTYSADGVIVSTATGSTAYSFSAGGPIIQPNAELIMVTPICPHSLNKGSIIFGSGDEVIITMSDNKRLSEERSATFDGEQFFNLITGDRIVVTKSEWVTRLIKTNRDSFLKRVSEKLLP